MAMIQRFPLVTLSEKDVPGARNYGKESIFKTSLTLASGLERQTIRLCVELRMLVKGSHQR